jgi:hypothetical protein
LLHGGKMPFSVARNICMSFPACTSDSRRGDGDARHRESTLSVVSPGSPARDPSPSINDSASPSDYETTGHGSRVGHPGVVVAATRASRELSPGTETFID